MTDRTALEYKQISGRNLCSCINIGNHDQILCHVTTDKHHSLRAAVGTRRATDIVECIQVSINYCVECC